MTEDKLKTGTTTIGIKCKDGVVMASERRATMGYTIANNHITKVYKIADNLCMTIAGVVGDAQLMVRYFQAEAALYQLRNGKPMSVNAAATLVANLIRQGFYLGLIVGGHDCTGGHIYTIDGAGGFIEDNYMSVGSGSTFALGSMEAGFKDDLSKQEGIDLAITALNSAMRRDAASGGGMLITYIDKTGVHFIDEEDIRTRTAELGYKYPNR